MTIENAQASLSSQFQCVPITGFRPYQDGIIDAQTSTVKNIGIGRWSNLSGSSWAQTKSYSQTFGTMRWTAPVIDLGAIQYFTLNIEAEFQGTLSYLIHISDTGAFAGEESEYYIQDGDTNVPGFYGRYIYVTSVLQGAELIKVLITANTQIKEYRIPNVNSATLAGSNTARQIALPTPVSLIKDIHIQPKAAQSYAVNLYVSATPTSEVLIPVIKSKSSTTPTFALYGIDNDPRDGVVDITVTALPRQAMLQGNLVVLE